MREGILTAVLLATLTMRVVYGASPAQPKFDKVPGVVITHSPQSSGQYIGSPSIAVLPNGDYLASHDFFGPKTKEHEKAISEVFRSSDRGQTWKQVARLEGLFWANLFVHNSAAYIMGPHKHHGLINIRRSTDGGNTWTEPLDANTGWLTSTGEFHTAPMPVVLHNGRLWRAYEDASGGKLWGVRYMAMMMSVPANADLLKAENWTFSSRVARNPEWLGGTFNAWLEGNAVLTRDGRMLDILRVDVPAAPEKAAIVSISADGKTASFDPEKGFINFPGGAKKFTIRYDAKSDTYWSLASIILDRHSKGLKPGGVRNTLALTCSQDLTNWTVRCILLYHPDTAKHGFQYVDWLFDGDDIIAACRTAYEDGLTGAHNNHDANFLTFHRVVNFRTKTMANSVPLPEYVPVKAETADLQIIGHGWKLQKFNEGEKAFANRTYVWSNVPAAFKGWQITQVNGGEHGAIVVTALKDTTLHVATALGKADERMKGWKKTGQDFCYNDTGKTKMTVFTRVLKKDQEMVLPQDNWTGTMVLIPTGQ